VAQEAVTEWAGISGEASLDDLVDAIATASSPLHNTASKLIS
jgi:hypothetical protein